MAEAEALLAIISLIYDGALDPTMWPQTLSEISRFVGGCAAGVYAKDVVSRTGEIFFDDGGLAPEHIASYFDRYVELDPVSMRQFFADVGAITSTADLISFEEFFETRIYREWVQPQGLIDHASAVLRKSSTSVSLFGVFRNERQGIADDEMRRRMLLFVPHMQRAVRIAGALDWQQGTNEVLAGALDKVKAGIVLVTVGGAVAHANAAGIRALSEGPLRMSGGRIAGVDATLECFLQTVRSGSGDEPATAHSIIDSGGDRWVIHALPLAGRRGEVLRARGIAVILFLQRAELPSLATPEVIAKALGLTPSELRVLLSVVELGSVRLVAEALGIGETTVKFHLRSLYEKTGARRQADLVKLVAGYASPLAE